MFGMFPFIPNNNFNNNWNNNNSFSNLLNDGFFNSIVDQVLSSDVVNDIFQDMLNEDPYDIEFKDYGSYYLIKGYLPGIGPKDVSIDFEKNKAILTIRRKQTYSNGTNMMMTVIQSGGSLVKTFYVEEIDVTKLKASFDNDLLILMLPKSKSVDQIEEEKEDQPTIIDVENYKVE